MNRGTVLFHKEFSFYDGEIGEKLIILLNTPPDMNTPYLFCKTTSNQRYHPLDEGCHPTKNLFMLNIHPRGFKKKTCVQFHDLYLLNYKDMLSAKFDGKVTVQMELEASAINGIVNCVRKSEDTSNFHLALLK